MSSDDSDSVDMNDALLQDHGLESHHHSARCQACTYDEAISKAINRKSCLCFSMLYQNLSLLVVTCGVMACNPIILGISFLEREPNEFMCKNAASAPWQTCDKSYICEQLGGDTTAYYAVDNEYYIENWVKRFGMLCESRMLTGLLGFSYFAGVVIATIMVTQLAAENGKKVTFCYSLVISLIGQLGILFWATSILEALLCLFVIGLSWPGKRVIGVDYILDFFPMRYRSSRILLMNLLDYPSIILIALAYEYLQKTWVLQQYIGLACSSVCLLFCSFVMTKSPFHLYQKRQYAEARSVIEYMMRLNGDFTKLTFKFDTEHRRETRRNVNIVYR